MAKHDALIEWRSDGNFASGRYSRAHQWRFDGGAVVPGSSSPSVVPPPMSDPAAVDPEEALVAAASSCHMLWFLSLAHDAGFEVESYRDAASGEMGKDDRGRTAIRTIRLRPAIVFAGREPSPEELAQLHHEAHEKCFIANSLRSEVLVEDPAPE
jgi:organic hydroperoxide reductase OsmC/OhrA